MTSVTRDSAGPLLGQFNLLFFWGAALDSKFECGFGVRIKLECGPRVSMSPDQAVRCVPSVGSPWADGADPSRSVH